MSFTIGRATALSDPYTWSQSGDIVETEGTLHDTSTHVVKAIRQQLLGYVGNVDEPVVPVTSSTDSHIDGFYRVLAANVDVPRGGHALKQYAWTVTLERVADYAAPLVESRLLAPNVRDTEHGTDHGSHYVGFPASAVETSAGTEVTVASEDGNMSVRYVAAGTAPPCVLQDVSFLYKLSASDWYDGACRIELDYADDGTFRPVAGRQILDLPGEQRWRVSNGIIRVTLEDPSSMILGVSRWTGSVWSTPTEFYVGTKVGSTSTPFSAPHTISVLRNGVETAVLRLLFANTTGGYAYLDLVLRRGMPWCEVLPTWDQINVGSAGNWSAGRATTDSGVAFDDVTDPTGVDDAGLKNNTADGDGFIWMVATPWTIDDLDTSDGNIMTTLTATVQRPSFMLGLSLDTGDALAPTTPEGAVLNYLAGQSETVRLVEQ